MNNYIFCISIVLNGVLLMALFGIIPFLLYLSIILNLGLLWYIKKTLENTKNLERDLTNVMTDINYFEEHLEDIYGLEMYYGDQNLENLIVHARELINNFIDFQERSYDVDVELEEEQEEEEDAEDQRQTEEE